LTDGGVVHAFGKADLAQGRESLRDANAEAEIMAVPTPSLAHLFCGLAHCDGQSRLPAPSVQRRQRVIEEHYDLIAAVVVERPLKRAMPGGAVEVIRDQLNRLTAQPNSTLRISFSDGPGLFPSGAPMAASRRSSMHSMSYTNPAAGLSGYFR